MTPDFNISVIQHAKDTATAPSTFRSVMEEIRSDRWSSLVSEVRSAYAAGGKDAASEPKKRLPGILFSGTFTKRSSADLIQHSGLICADLDELGSRLETTFEQVCADPRTLACFRSPTGAGLKVVFRCDPAKPHIDSFHALEHYALQNFGLQIDQKCSDVSRICFVSHDPEAFVGDDAEVLPYPDAPPSIPYTSPVRSPGTDMPPGDDFNLRGGSLVPEILRSHGWTHVRGKYWCRPGKTGDVSASWEHYPNTLHVFSDSPETGFPPERNGFDPFAIYAHMECQGDFSRAAKELSAKGYGTQIKSRQQANLERIAGPEPIKPKSSQWPDTTKASALCLTPPPTPSILIDGILYRGGTMLVSGPSKSHKTYTMLDCACAIAEGRPWMGFNTVKTVVLYLNLELQDFATADRLTRICSAAGHPAPDNLHMWNLRGQTVTMSALSKALPEKIRELGAGFVVIDPHYKVSSVSGMEENSNDDQGNLLSTLEGLCGLNGAAFAACHHFAKGDASAKNAIDRASGGGVFARWGDVMLTFTPHEEDDAMSVEMSLRNFAPVEPFVVRWAYPRWSRDEDLDPSKLKQRGGSKEKFSSDGLLKVLGDKMLNYKEWLDISGMTESTFKRKRSELLKSGKVTQQMGIYRQVFP